MMETLDGAFCPKINSDPGLVCVSFLCGCSFVVQLGFFFSPIVLYSYFSALEFLLFGIIYYTMLRLQIR